MSTAFPTLLRQNYNELSVHNKNTHIFSHCHLSKTVHTYTILWSTQFWTALLSCTFCSSHTIFLIILVFLIPTACKLNNYSWIWWPCVPRLHTHWYFYVYCTRLRQPGFIRQHILTNLQFMQLAPFIFCESLPFLTLAFIGILLRLYMHGLCTEIRYEATKVWTSTM